MVLLFSAEVRTKVKWRYALPKREKKRAKTVKTIEKETLVMVLKKYLFMVLKRYLFGS